MEKKTIAEEIQSSRKFIGPLSDADLAKYKPRRHGTAEFDRSHLRLGMTVPIMTLVAEKLGYIKRRNYKEYLCDAARSDCRSAFYWKYDDSYKRPPECAWLDAEVGPLVPNEGTQKDYPQFGLTNTVGYDFAIGVVTKWLKENNCSDLSMCEAVLQKEEFSSFRRETRVANVFWSHVQNEPFLLGGTIQYMNMAEKKGDMPLTATVWLDYYGLRQCQKDFYPPAVVELIGEIGSVVASTGDFQYVKRSFCVFEMGAAIHTGATLKCQVGKYRDTPSMPTMRQYSLDFFLEKNPIDIASASARRPQDKKDVDEFIETLNGGFGALNDRVTQTLLKYAPTRGN